MKNTLREVFASVSGALGMLTGDGYAYGYQAGTNAFDYMSTAFAGAAKKAGKLAEETVAYTTAAMSMLSGEGANYGYAVAKDNIAYAKTAYGARFGKRK
ncbi:MAG: hypothetical protein EA357_06805 [Micavibrio sp.]|nr:MAG: hypothetical protein EA357_06805 [Micavibrio sp.]